MLVLAAAVAGGAARAAAAPAPLYRASADRICATTNARLAAVPAPRDADDVRAWMLRAVPIMSRSVARVRALAPPRALRTRHRAWVSALGARAAATQALRRRIAAGAPPVATLEAARPRLQAQKRTARARARALGLRACAGRPAATRR